MYKRSEGMPNIAAASQDLVFQVDWKYYLMSRLAQASYSQMR